MGLQPHQGSPGQRPLLQIKGLGAQRLQPLGGVLLALRGLALRGLRSIQPLQLQPALGSRRCSTSPSGRALNTVRSEPCRSARPCTAARRAPASSGPVMRRAPCTW